MADSPISSLPVASEITDYDMFVMEQNGVAKQVLGSLISYFINRNVLDVEITELPATEDVTYEYDPETGTLEIGIPRGAEGTAANLDSNEIAYQISQSGSSVPTGEWSETPIAPQAGQYLWQRTTLNFNTGYPVVFYTVARSGIDGLGPVSYVCNISPDQNGNVSLTAANIGAVPTTRTVNGMQLSSDIVTRLSFTNKTVETSDWTEDSTTTWHEDFPYRARIACQDVASSMFADVVLYPEDAMSGIFAPVSNTGTNYVDIWASEVPADDIIIPTIYVMK